MNNTDLHNLTSDHSRIFQDQKYVYPVVSRRSRGVSIGINISPNCLCNFLCAYCQVNGDYRQERENRNGSIDIDFSMLRTELEKTVSAVTSDSLYEIPSFSKIPDEKRRLNDIAFSGDGEPTLSPAFHQAMQIAVETRKMLCPESVKIVLITNATTLQSPKVVETLDLMMQNHGEIWAKLDAGSEEQYRRINRSKVPFAQILQNLETISQRYPIVIQSILLCENGVSPSEKQIDDLIARLNGILNAGGQIDRVQLYTIARSTIEHWVSPLNAEQMGVISVNVTKVTGLRVETF